MKVEVFIEKMNRIQSVITSNDEVDYSYDFLEIHKNRFKFISFKKKIEFVNQILRLIDENDCSNFELGMITLNEKIKEDIHFYYFGKFEEDNLVINKVTSAIELLELGQFHKLSHCAINAERFLDAIYEAALFLSKISMDDDVSEHPEVCVISKRCAELAGGDSISFYSMLLGCY